jgi:tetratricopeptide (TPR) repeat protein
MTEHRRVLELTEAVGTADPAWLTDRRAAVVAAVRGCDQDGSRRLGTRLAAAVWPVAGHVPDPGWWAILAEAGEALAIKDRDPAALAELLHGAAATFAAHGDRLRAEERWVRALAISRRDALHDRSEIVLRALGGMYRDWGRHSKALDAYLGLVDLRRDRADQAGTADALAEVGTTMYAAGRLRSAMEYFDRADEAMHGADAPREHAGILVWCGRTRWEQGEHGAARRRWSRALAMLVDVDDDAANQVRALLATDSPEFPYPNTSSSPSGGVG